MFNFLFVQLWLSDCRSRCKHKLITSSFAKMFWLVPKPVIHQSSYRLLFTFHTRDSPVVDLCRIEQHIVIRYSQLTNLLDQTAVTWFILLVWQFIFTTSWTLWLILFYFYSLCGYIVNANLLPIVPLLLVNQFLNIELLSSELKHFVESVLNGIQLHCPSVEHFVDARVKWSPLHLKWSKVFHQLFGLEADRVFQLLVFNCKEAVYLLLGF